MKKTAKTDYTVRKAWDKTKKISQAFYFRADANKLLASVRFSFILLIPIFMIGAIALVLLNFPVEAVRVFIRGSLAEDGTVLTEAFLGGGVRDALLLVYNASFGIASVLVLLCISYKYCQLLTGGEKILPFYAVFAALLSYFALIGVIPIGTNTVSFGDINVNNIFAALLTAALSTRLFTLLFMLFAKNRLLRRSMASDIVYRHAVLAILPLFLTAAAFAAFAVALNALTGTASLTGFIIYAFSFPFKNLKIGLGSGLLVVFFQTVFWFFGVHGSNVFDSLMKTTFSDAAAPVNKIFLDTFVLMGGCGSTICLLAALLLFSKSRPDRQICKNSAVFMAFNINEIMVYGLPVVFNPIYLLPFLLTPMALMLISYGAVSLGIVSVVSEPFWTTPPLIGGYLATGSLLGSLLQLFNIAVGALIYMPFIRLSDKLLRVKYAQSIDALVEEVKKAEETGKPAALLSGTGNVNAVAREMAFALRQAVRKKTVQMYYQPQIDDKGKAVACEALLRWKFFGDKFIYPPLLIAIAKEDDSYGLLNDYIIDTVLEDTVTLNNMFGTEFEVSFNMTAENFNDAEFIRQFLEKVKAKIILPGTLCVEITENNELRDNHGTGAVFDVLKENRIKVAIDDFSMGHTSINYLLNYGFSFVKLDGQIVKNIVENERSRDIIKSITSLGGKLGFRVIAEFVETEAVKDLLLKMDVKLYQGWLYSPAVPLDRLMYYVKDKNIESDNEILRCYLQDKNILDKNGMPLDPGTP